jgi:hypothetical protein
VESWRLEASADDAFLVARGERAGRLEHALLIAGDHFLFVRNRSVDLPVARSLDSLIAGTDPSREQIVAYLDCEFSTGRVRGGSRPWEIQASTLPWLEGRPLAFVKAVAVLPDSTNLNIRTDSGERWTVPINTLPKAVLASLFSATP